MRTVRASRSASANSASRSTAPSAGGSWKNGSSKCQGASSPRATPNRTASASSSVSFHAANGAAVCRSTSSSVARSRPSSISPTASESAKWSRDPTARAASLRSRASSRTRPATAAPTCFDASHARRRNPPSTLARRMSRMALSATGAPSSSPRNDVNVASTSVSRSTIRRCRSPGTWFGSMASWSKSSWRASAPPSRVRARASRTAANASPSASSCRRVSSSSALRRLASGEACVLAAHHAWASSTSTGWSRSTSSRASPPASCTAAQCRGHHQRSIATDAAGLPIGWAIAGANRHDPNQGGPTFEAVTTGPVNFGLRSPPRSNDRRRVAPDG